MKILFVSSGNKKFEDSPIVRKQGESIKKAGADIEFYLIIDKGLAGYIKNIFRLRRFLKTNYYNLIHAHYSLSGMVASLASRLPVVVSLMGSDVQSRGIMAIVMSYFCRRKWKAVIVKSESMKKQEYLKESFVIPNGVDFNVFQFIDRRIAREKVGFDSKKHIIFVGNPGRKEKNFQLAEQAFALLNNPDVELNVVSGVNYELLPYYYSAADVLLLTSLWEGSPNVVKEAMACNLPIVSTNVGDVKKIIGETRGCFVTSFGLKDVANKLKIALEFGIRTNGREKIKHLDNKIIAKKIISIYEKVIQNV